MYKRRYKITVLLIVTVIAASCSTDNRKELSLDEARTLIEGGKITEVHLTSSTVEMKSVSGSRYFTSIGIDATRKFFVKTVETVNAEGGQIKLTESQSQSQSCSGNIYSLILNTLPLILLVTRLVIPVLLFLIYRELKKRNDAG